jgi:ankyrin repeat protein
MSTIHPQDPVAQEVVSAIRAGQPERVEALLAEHDGLASAYVGEDGPHGQARSLLHIATDWPGHFPNVAAIVRTLVNAGADVNARFRGPHRETPLHWAASSDDVEAISALVDAGADIDADGGVIADGTALSDATAFGQWNAARVLVERGARATLIDLAALGMTAEVLAGLDGPEPPSSDEVNAAFWSACHGSQLATAQVLLDHGADLDWLPGWERATPLDIAARVDAREVVEWLEGLGARTSAGLGER